MSKKTIKEGDKVILTKERAEREDPFARHQRGKVFKVISIWPIDADNPIVRLRHNEKRITAYLSSIEKLER